MFQEVGELAEKIGIGGALAIFFAVLIGGLMTFAFFKILVPGFKAHMGLVKNLNNTTIKMASFMEHKINKIDKKVNGVIRHQRKVEELVKDVKADIKILTNSME